VQSRVELSRKHSVRVMLHSLFRRTVAGWERVCERGEWTMIEKILF
jgi:hypothetical protein